MIIEDSLLDKAMSAPQGRHRPHRNNAEMVELAIAYMRGEITATQAAAALGTSRQGAFQRMMTQFVRAVKDGRVEISRRRERGDE